MILKKPAMEAYKEGVKNGTISSSMQEVIETVIEQEVVSYCSTKGTYTFDYMDVDYRYGSLQR